MLDETLGETLRERAKVLLRECERKKAKTAAKIDYYDRAFTQGEPFSQENHDDWRNLECYQMQLDLEEETTIYVIVYLGLLTSEEIAEYINNLKKSEASNEAGTRR